MTAIYKLWKVELAERLRLMRDNERILNHQADVKEALDKRHLNMDSDKAPPGEPLPESKMPGDINIDSPTTINNHPTAPTAAAPVAKSLASRLAPWIVGPAIGGLGVGIGSYLNRPTTPKPAADHPDLQWRLVIPDEPKGVTQ